MLLIAPSTSSGRDPGLPVLLSRLRCQKGGGVSRGGAGRRTRRAPSSPPSSYRREPVGPAPFTRLVLTVLLLVAVVAISPQHGVVLAYTATAPLVTVTRQNQHRSISTTSNSWSRIHPFRGTSSSSSRPIPTSTSSTALRYRSLDEQDNEDDPSYVRVKSKANAFGLYDVKKAVLDDDGPDQGTVAPGRGGGGAPRGTTRRRRSALNIGLIRALELNQVLILALGAILFFGRLVLSGGFQALGHVDDVLQWAGTTTDIASTGLFQQLLWGVGGALPLLALSNLIENSDQRAFANVNFSTIVMAMTLFGRRRAPPEEFLPSDYPSAQEFPTTTAVEAAYRSLTMSTVTGLCEETVFRQFVPAMIVASTGHVSWALLGQAILFGLGHSNPKSPTSENAIVVGLQVINGLGFGSLYLLSGGDIVPCIVAHALYDFVTFFATWTSANDQLEYAERMYQEPLSPDQEQQVQQLLKSASRRLDPKLYRAVKRLFYTFDFDKNKTLSLSEVRKGVAYMALERAGAPPPQDQVDQMFLAAVEARRRSAVAGSGSTDGLRLTFADFLRLYLNMLSRAANQPPVAA